MARLRGAADSASGSPSPLNWRHCLAAGGYHAQVLASVVIVVITAIVIGAVQLAPFRTGAAAICVRLRGRLVNDTATAAAGPPPSLLRVAPPGPLPPGSALEQRAQAANWVVWQPSPVPPEPSRESFLRLEADPSLVEREPALLAEFEAAPWLLPPNTKGLPYAGVTSLEQLLELRAVEVGGYRTVTLIPGNIQFAELLQNCIYSLVKFGRASSYIVLTWEAAELAACAAMNLPCADVTSFLPGPVRHGENAGIYGSHDYQVIVWVKPRVVLHVLKLGYAAYLTDADVAFANKPVVESLIKLITVSQADGGFQFEEPINTGNYLLLPTNASIAVMERLVEVVSKDFKAENVGNDQQTLITFRDQTFRLCTSTARCHWMRNEDWQKEHPSLALFRPYFLAQWSYEPDICIDLQFTPRIDPCDRIALFAHSICIIGLDPKKDMFRRIGWWYMDSNSTHACAPRAGSTSQVAIYHPLQWRLPETEEALYRCRPQLAWVYPGMEPG